ncbi:MAG TPA: hypothetical protein VM425_02005 [Myxococcota bacterium]|nr:hypothetical protein [Myxococcota bacterium]
MKSTRRLLLPALIVFALLFACKSVNSNLDSGTDDGAGGDGDKFVQPDIVVCDPGSGPHSLTIDNRYLPMPVGRKLVLEGHEGTASVHLEVTVLDQTETVAGVKTRVLEERWA